MGMLDGPKGEPEEIKKLEQELVKGMDGITDEKKVEDMKMMFRNIESTIDGLAKRFSKDVTSEMKGFNQVGDSAKKVEEYFKDKVIDSNEIGEISQMLLKLTNAFKSLNNSFGPVDVMAAQRINDYINEAAKYGVKKENSCGPVAIGTLLALKSQPVDMGNIIKFAKTGITGTWPGDLAAALKECAGSCKIEDSFSTFDEYYQKLTVPCITKIDTGLFNQHYVTIESKDKNGIKTVDGLQLSFSRLQELTGKKGGTIWSVG